MLQWQERLAGLPVQRIFLAAFGLVLLVKLGLAASLDLYSDEVFYWQAASQPALAYSDLPFMTALLAGLGSALSPGSAFAVRLLFIVLGSCIPLLVYWIALPLSDRRQALEAALLALCLPLGGFLGLLAVPDVPLVFFGLLSLGLFHRALASDELRYWLATAVVVALGLCTHYRFFLYPAGVVLWLLFYKPVRPQWRNPRLWLALGIASTGLAPILWFNLSHELSSASFYLLDRHPWQFQASGLLHIFKQAGLVTPPLYLLLGLSAYLLYGRARDGEQAAALLLAVAAINISVFMILAPWTDATSTSIHWPLSGYFPLLITAPAALRWLASYCAKRWSDASAFRLVIAIPLFGLIGTAAAFVGIGSQAFQLPLQSLVGKGVLSNKMAGWQEFAQYTRQVMAAHPDAQSLQLVTDNYYTAAQVEFAGLTADAITIDRDKSVRDGRFTQYGLWAKDESGLEHAVGRPILYINEDSTLTVPAKHALLETMCEYVDELTLLGELSLFNGDKRFSFYGAGSIIARGVEVDRARPCPFPARGWIDYPPSGAVLIGPVEVSGWAYNEDLGIAAVHLLIDSRRVARLDYGQQRLDVATTMSVRTDPNSPALGFAGLFDSSSLTNGEYMLAIEMIDSQGTVSSYGSRPVRIAN